MNPTTNDEVEVEETEDTVIYFILRHNDRDHRRTRYGERVA